MEAKIVTNLKIDDEVTLHDVVLNRKSSSIASTDEKGSGYKVTAATKNFVECTKRSMDISNSNRTSFYSVNDLHYIKKG